jgi:hypothetical protein
MIDIYSWQSYEIPEYTLGQNRVFLIDKSDDIG